jgi:hypothetical protein
MEVGSLRLRHRDELAPDGRRDVAHNEATLGQRRGRSHRAGDPGRSILGQDVHMTGQGFHSVEQRDGMPAQLRGRVRGGREHVVAAQDEDELLVVAQVTADRVGALDEFAVRQRLATRGVDRRHSTGRLEAEEAHTIIDPSMPIT